MVPIPHSFVAPLVALALSLAVAFACRAKPRLAWVPAGAAVAALLGWAILVPAGRLPHAALAPRLAPEILIAPAAVCALAAAWLAWRGQQRVRGAAIIMAGFAGWWVARGSVGPSEFWRVWFAVAVLAGMIGWAIRGRASYGLALAGALWGSLFVTGSAWTGAAAVAAAVMAGLLAGSTALPPAAMAALLVSADLAGGRVLRGRLDGTDAACLLALASPMIARAIEARLGKRWGPAGPASAAIGAAAGATAVAWLLRRAVFS